MNKEAFEEGYIDYIIKPKSIGMIWKLLVRGTEVILQVGNSIVVRYDSNDRWYHVERYGALGLEVNGDFKSRGDVIECGEPYLGSGVFDMMNKAAFNAKTGDDINITYSVDKRIIMYKNSIMVDREQWPAWLAEWEIAYGGK